MPKSEKRHATGKVKPGDVKQRVGVEQIASRGNPGEAPYSKNAGFYNP